VVLALVVLVAAQAWVVLLVFLALLVVLAAVQVVQE
jgi:hypothetical protein